MNRRTLLVECDLCGARRQSRVGEGIASLRERLAAVGWLSDAAADTDVCANHRPEAVPS